MIRVSASEDSLINRYILDLHKLGIEYLWADGENPTGRKLTTWGTEQLGKMIESYCHTKGDVGRAFRAEGVSLNLIEG